MTTNLTNLCRKFDRDEEGLESLQVVMIIAIAAMILIAVSTVGKATVGWMKGNLITLWDTAEGATPAAPAAP